MGVAAARLGRLAEACERWEQELAVALELGDRSSEAASRFNLGTALQILGRLDDAVRYTELALAAFREIGDRQGETGASGNLGSVSQQRGELVDAVGWYERKLELSREIGAVSMQAHAWMNLGAIRLDLGQLDRAQPALQQSSALARESGDPYILGYALQAVGRLAAEKDDSAGAQHRWEEGLAVRRKIGHGEGISACLIALGEHWYRTGDPDRARPVLEEAATWSREQGVHGWHAVAMALLACLPGGDPAPALAALAEADTPGDKLRARWFLFRATDDRTHLDAAKRLLDEALSKVPEEYHESMCRNVRLNREILAAWREEFGEDDDRDNDDPPSESVTRAGLS
jgi:tetratricopeptide (TPR) repeat protein